MLVFARSSEPSQTPLTKKCLSWPDPLRHHGPPPPPPPRHHLPLTLPSHLLLLFLLLLAIIIPLLFLLIFSCFSSSLPSSSPYSSFSSPPVSPPPRYHLPLTLPSHLLLLALIISSSSSSLSSSSSHPPHSSAPPLPHLPSSSLSSHHVGRPTSPLIWFTFYNFPIHKHIRFKLLISPDAVTGYPENKCMKKKMVLRFQNHRHWELPWGKWFNSNSSSFKHKEFLLEND